MKEEYQNLVLNKNEETSRFELTVNGFTAFIDYKESDQKIWLIHTESPAELKGRGVATALIEKTLHYLDENKYELIPLCPMVFAYIKKHPEWKKIVSSTFKGFDE